ncbi:hypothetical protein JCM6882_009501 [Rhodosporidiobolus microsporus]
MPFFHRTRRTHHSTGVTTTRTTRTRHSHNPFARRAGGNGRSHRQNRIAGLKAARSNPRTSASASHSAGNSLTAMGARKNRVPISTRIKRALHIGPYKRTRRTRRV